MKRLLISLIMIMFAGQAMADDAPDADAVVTPAGVPAAQNLK